MGWESGGHGEYEGVHMYVTDHASEVAGNCQCIYKMEFGMIMFGRIKEFECVNENKLIDRKRQNLREINKSVEYKV